ncbi:AAEL007999-PA [Aedes aegypti]|uniref:AAEL007999-PA n=2 Tax=Aedes aegypti TaxID=7159 RepID=A0A1S4FIB4_AEDAE|nr:clavesin-1 [Aedes aegypti]EAT40269.1 AAEL007999-PA [Aedes aegypti]
MSAPCLDKIPESYDDHLAEMETQFQQHAKTYLREEPELRRQMLVQLRDWIAKHPHIRKVRTDALFLLKFLRAKKYNFINATKLLERYLATKVLHRDWFGRLDIEDPELGALVDTGYLFPLPERDSKGRTLLFSVASGIDPARFTGRHACRLHMMTAELCAESNEFLCGGFILVYDFSNITLAHLNVVSFNDIRLLSKAANNSLAVRAQEVHFVNTPSAGLTIANFALQLTNEKLRNRIFCHKNWDELYKKVDKDLLPKEYGGKIPQAELIESFKKRCTEMRPLLLAYDEMDMEIANDSEYRNDGTGDELESGAIGTFRKLQVD